MSALSEKTQAILEYCKTLSMMDDPTLILFACKVGVADQVEIEPLVDLKDFVLNAIREKLSRDGRLPTTRVKIVDALAEKASENYR